MESYVGTAAGCHNGRVLASFEVMTDALREKLVDAGRVLVSEDQGDYVAGHVTLRLPGGDGRFLMKPAGIGFEEMTPEGIITVDREGGAGSADTAMNGDSPSRVGRERTPARRPSFCGFVRP